MKQLAERFPQLAARLPHVPLASLPTPLESAAELARLLDIGALLIKRDDLSGQAYGGNKVRKLELLLADARDQGCDAVMTFGAAGSNHVLATAIYARQLGLDCYGLLVPQPASPKVAATLRYHAWLGTRLITATGRQGIMDAADQACAAHPGGPARVYRIPWGGSSWLGATGFVNAALELAEQCSEPPDRIYLANGTMGTTIGLGIGLHLLGWPTQVVAVRVAPEPVNNTKYFTQLFTETAQQLRARDNSLPPLDDAVHGIVLRDGFLGDGYALPTPGTLEATDLAERHAGLRLDTTYTGKAMAALVSDARTGDLAGQRILFWHTYNGRAYPGDIDSITADRLPEALRHYL